MNKKIIAASIVVVLVIAAGVYAIFGMNEKEASAPSKTVDSNTQTSVPSSDAPETDSTQNEAATIAFTNDGFTPNSLTVKKGTVVTVKNESSNRVQFSSDDHPSHRLNTEMNLKTLSAGENATFMANTIGTHGFHDHIDDSKTGTLTVTE